MAKISEFPVLTQITGNEELPLAFDGENYKLNLQLLVNQLQFTYKGSIDEIADLPKPADSKYGDFVIVESNVWMFINSSAGIMEWVDLGDVRGPAGRDGTGINIIGPLPEVDDLPVKGDKNGDSYLIQGIIYVWTGEEWSIFGQEGPAGKDAFEVWKAKQPKPAEATWEQYIEDIRGPKGDSIQGDPGLTAYEVAKKNGYQGNEQEWLASLNGEDGESAYQVAVKGGFVGTEAEWLKTLVGPEGQSVYQLAVEQGFEGTEDEYLASLKAPRMFITGAVEHPDDLPAEGQADQIWLVGLNMYVWINGKWFDAGTMKGERGEPGKKGDAGDPGLSAYEVAVEEGYKGSVTDWLASIKGDSAYQVALAAGFVGTEQDWLKSLAGTPGLTAYQVAKNNGYTGTEVEWLESLKGQNGKSAYQVAVDYGFSGTETEWLLSLRAPGFDHIEEFAGQEDFPTEGDPKVIYLVGDTMYLWTTDGYKATGEFRGPAGKSAFEVAQEHGFTGTFEEWQESLRGPKGDSIKGDQGKSAYQVAVDEGYQGTSGEWLKTLEGKTAYQIAVKNGFKGTESQWLATLNGKNGESAYQVALRNGFKGTEQQWLESIDGQAGISAYQVAVNNGFKGSEEEWLDSLVGVGAQGPEGKQGPAGPSVPVKDYLTSEDQLPPTGVAGDNYVVNGIMWTYSVAEGKFVNTEIKIKGEDGKDGKDGINGLPGRKGADGLDGNRVIPLAVKPTALDGQVSDLAWVYTSSELWQKVTVQRWVFLSHIGGGNVYDTDSETPQARVAGKWVDIDVLEAPKDGHGQIRRDGKWEEFGQYTANIFVTADGVCDTNKSNAFIIDGTKTVTIKLENLRADRAQVLIFTVKGSNGSITWPANLRWTENRAPTMGVELTNIAVFWDGVNLTASVSQRI